MFLNEPHFLLVTLQQCSKSYSFIKSFEITIFVSPNLHLLEQVITRDSSEEK